MLAKGYTGFLEWLPSSKRKEKEIIDLISSIYESYGYTPIETAAVERVEDLINFESDISKEIYGLNRLAGESKEKFGLRFDQTLPLARYTANNYAALQFPFKRYQIQKVWRGEKPQTGRYREFYQADIDVIGDEKLPLFYEAEVVEVIYQIFKKLNFGDFRIKINNRKLLEGLYKEQKIENLNEVLIIVDKVKKMGSKKVKNLLLEKKLNERQADFCINLAQQSYSLAEVNLFLNKLKLSNELLKQAKEELEQIFLNLKHLDNEKIIFDLSIARGLDYYTGSVYETEIVGLEKFGSVCSGGRYDNLSGKFSKKNLPGVGISIGLSRLLFLLFNNEKLKPLASTPIEVYIILFEESQRQRANKVAYKLRKSGICIEVSHRAAKLVKQIQFALKRGATYILILEENNLINMKNLRTGIQEKLDIEKICIKKGKK